METIHFIAANLDMIGQRMVEHISIVLVAVGIATITAVPIGIAITQSKSVADTVLYLASMMITVPSIALFGLMIPLLSPIGHGIGYVPAVIAVILYSQLPIIRNTYTAITNIDPVLREAARGMGMSNWQRLRQVEIPLAVPVIMAGVRTAVVMNIGVTAIAAYIGAGGLGTLIARGISQTDPRQLIAGALSPTQFPRHPILMARFGLEAIRTAESLASRFRTEEAKALIAGCAAHAILPLDKSLTAAVALIFLITGHMQNWAIARGGSHAIGKALASYFRSLGGEIQTGHRVSNAADLPDARAYLFDTSPNLLAGGFADVLPAGYIARLGKFRYGPGVFKLDWALAGSNVAPALRATSSDSR